MSDADLFDPPTAQRGPARPSDADLFDPPVKRAAAKPAAGFGFGWARGSAVDQMPGKTERERLNAFLQGQGTTFTNETDAKGLPASPATFNAGAGRGASPGNPGMMAQVQPQRFPQLQQDESPILNLARNVAGNVIGPVAGGIAGLASLPFAGPTGAADISQDVQSRLSYTPPEGTQSAAVVNAFNSGYNPLTWIPRGAAAVGEFAGGALADAGMPGAGALVNGTIQSAPMALGLPRVAGAAGRGLASVGDALAPSKPLPIAARVDPMLEQAPKPTYVMRDGKIVPKEVVPVAAAAPAATAPIMGDARATAGPAAPAATAATATVPGRPDLPLSAVTPALAAEFQKAAASGKPLNAAATRQAEAQSLPVPTTLTEGQAMLHPGKISDELNARGMLGAKVTPEFLNQQAKALSGSLEAVRAKAAPEVTAVDPIQHGQALVDAYKTVDAPIVADINAKYQALRDANGGQFPVDAAALHANVKAALAKELLTHDAPAGQMNALQALAEGGGAMSMEQFLNMRRNLGAVARTSADGNARAAASAMIKELEKLPLQDGAAALKPMADAARNAAKARFDKIDADPAYAAAVGDDVRIGESSPLADKFVDRYVMKAPRANVMRMQQNLAEVPVAKQTIAAGVIDSLRGRAKADVEAGKFAADSYNGALGQVVPKADALFDAQTAAQLQQIGRVAKYTSIQPKGSYANNSGTLVGAMSDVGQAGLRVGAAGMTGGASEVAIHTAQRMAAPILAKRAQAKATSPTAGVKTLGDVGK